MGLEPWVEQALIPAFQPLMMTIALINRKPTAEEIIGWSIEAIPAMALSARGFIWEEVRMLINVFGLERPPLPASCAPVY